MNTSLLSTLVVLMGVSNYISSKKVEKYNPPPQSRQRSQHQPQPNAIYRNPNQGQRAPVREHFKPPVNQQKVQAQNINQFRQRIRENYDDHTNTPDPTLLNVYMPYIEGNNTSVSDQPIPSNDTLVQVLEALQNLLGQVMQNTPQPVLCNGSDCVHNITNVDEREVSLHKRMRIEMLISHIESPLSAAEAIQAEGVKLSPSQLISSSFGDSNWRTDNVQNLSFDSFYNMMAGGPINTLCGNTAGWDSNLVQKTTTSIQALYNNDPPTNLVLPTNNSDSGVLVDVFFGNTSYKVGSNVVQQMINRGDILQQGRGGKYVFVGGSIPSNLTTSDSSGQTIDGMANLAAQDATQTVQQQMNNMGM